MFVNLCGKIGICMRSLRVSAFAQRNVIVGMFTLVGVFTLTHTIPHKLVDCGFHPSGALVFGSCLNWLPPCGCGALARGLAYHMGAVARSQDVANRSARSVLLMLRERNRPQSSFMLGPGPCVRRQSSASWHEFVNEKVLAWSPYVCKYNI